MTLLQVEKLGRLLAKQLEGMRQHCLADLTAKELTMQACMTALSAFSLPSAQIIELKIVLLYMVM